MYKFINHKNNFPLILTLVFVIITIFGLATCKQKDIINWKIYKNSEFGYEVKYPSNWYVKEEYRSKCGFKDCLENLYIENMKEKVIVAGGGPFTENGSFFKIVIIYAPNISSIEEWIQNGDIPDRVKQERLDSVKVIKIGGTKRKVWRGFGWAEAGVEFIYESRFYRIHYMSGSQKQFKKDLTTFERMLALFTLK